MVSVWPSNGDTILLLAIQGLTVGLLKVQPYLLYKDQAHVKREGGPEIWREVGREGCRVGVKELTL